MRSTLGSAAKLSILAERAGRRRVPAREARGRVEQGPVEPRVAAALPRPDREEVADEHGDSVDLLLAFAHPPLLQRIDFGEHPLDFVGARDVRKHQIAVLIQERLLHGRDHVAESESSRKR